MEKKISNNSKIWTRITKIGIMQKTDFTSEAVNRDAGAFVGQGGEQESKGTC